MKEHDRSICVRYRTRPTFIHINPQQAEPRHTVTLVLSLSWRLRLARVRMRAPTQPPSELNSNMTHVPSRYRYTMELVSKENTSVEAENVDTEVHITTGGLPVSLHGGDYDLDAQGRTNTTKTRPTVSLNKRCSPCLCVLIGGRVLGSASETNVCGTTRTAIGLRTD